MDERHLARALPSDDLPLGSLREVTVDGRRVLVGRLRSGEVFATAPDCPHEAAPLAGGRIRGEAVDCPKHHYLFDARTGENLYPLPIYPRWKLEEVGDLSLRILTCREADGWIWVRP